MGDFTTATTIYSDYFSRITSTVVPLSVCMVYINDAESIVKGYLAKQYVLSTVVADVPALVAKVTKDLTVCNILQDAYTKDNANLNDWIETKKEGVFSLLEDLATDKIRLEQSNTVLSPDVNVSMKSNMSDISATFDVDDEWDWVISDTLLDTVDASRDANA